MLQSIFNAAVFTGRVYKAWQAGEGIVEIIHDLLENSDELSVPTEPGEEVSLQLEK